MSEKDIGVCARIAANSPLKDTYGFTRQGWENRLREAMNDSLSLLYLAEEEGAVAGFAWVHTKGVFLSAPYLRFIAISPAFSGKGLGSMLLDEFESRTRDGGRDFFLLVSDFNSNAIRFYEKHGYEKVGELKDFAVMGVREIIMRKENSRA